MSYQHSLVLIAPAALKDAANAMGNALGWSGENLSVPLSANGQEPATHYGCHAWAMPIGVAIFTGQTTPVAEGYSPDQINALRAQMIVSVDAAGMSGSEHFAATLSAHGLQAIA